MTKKAKFSSTDIFLLSLLAGGGLYSGGRLMQDARRAVAGTHTLPENNNELEVNIPTHLYAQEDDSEQRLDIPLKKAAENSILKSMLAAGVGVPVGFLGSKALYDAYQEQQLSKELEESKRKYYKTLGQAKFGQETPYVDGFCDVIKEAMEKKSDPEEDSPHSLTRALIAMFPGSGLVKSLYGALALTAAAGTFGTMYRADQNRRERETSRKFPEKVVLR